MSKKIILFCFVIVILFFVGYLLFPLVQPKPKIVPFSPEPSNWVLESVNQTKEIDVFQATKGESYVDAGGSQQYVSNDIKTVFLTEGWYKGNYFKDFYADDSGKVVMSFNQKMNPADGIIEGFIFEKFENSVPYIYIFIDEDWKSQIPNTWLYWGSFYDFNRSFVFNPVEAGIYMDKIEDDPDRFKKELSMRFGGLYVGDLRNDEFSTILSFK